MCMHPSERIEAVHVRMQGAGIGCGSQRMCFSAPPRLQLRRMGFSVRIRGQLAWRQLLLLAGRVGWRSCRHLYSPVQTSDWMIDETLATCEDHADADGTSSSMLALFFSRPVSCPVWVWPSRTMLCLLVPCPVSPTSPSCSNGRREH